MFFWRLHRHKSIDKSSALTMFLVRIISDYFLLVVCFFEEIDPDEWFLFELSSLAAEYPARLIRSRSPYS
jgi:hypothetical protein